MMSAPETAITSNVLNRFWQDFSAAIAETSDLRITEVLDVLDEALSDQLYPPREDGTDPRVCPKCGAGQLHLKPRAPAALSAAATIPNAPIPAHRR